jgi:hypothetical protein
MHLTRKIHFGLVMAAMLIVLNPGISQAVPPGRITQVTASPDARRVTVKCDGMMGSHTVSTGTNPSRLIIDVEGMGIARSPQINAAAKASGLDVRVAKSSSGARVVLDFGTSAIPSHKIRRLGNYLLVFLQEWEPKTGPSPSIEPRVEPRTEPRVETRRMPISNRPAPVPGSKNKGPYEGESPELSIKSAAVVDGLIVLTVAHRDNPGVTYRIDLGVDIHKLGFSMAKISSSEAGSPPGPSMRISAKRSPFWAQESGVRIGPRKSPPSSAIVEETETKPERTARLVVTRNMLRSTR